MCCLLVEDGPDRVCSLYKPLNQGRCENDLVSELNSVPFFFKFYSAL